MSQMEPVKSSLVKKPFSFMEWLLSMPTRAWGLMRQMWFYSRKTLWILSISSILFLLPYMAGVYIEETDEVQNLKSQRDQMMM